MLGRIWKVALESSTKWLSATFIVMLNIRGNVVWELYMKSWHKNKVDSSLEYGIRHDYGIYMFFDFVYSFSLLELANRTVCLPLSFSYL